MNQRTTGEVAIPYHAAPQAILEPTDALQALRERSGQVEIQSRLVGFLYDLLRDHLTPGVVEQIMRDTTDQPCLYTNGWLARYAEDLANRLTAGPSASGIATGQQLPGSDVVLPSRSENTLIPQTPQ